MIRISFYDYTTLLGYAVLAADDENMQRSIERIVARARSANHGAAPDLSTLHPRWEADGCAERMVEQVKHETWCDLTNPDRNSADRCTCRFPEPTAVDRMTGPARKAQDTAELAERQLNAQWHLQSCPWSLSGGGGCTCDARGWMARRAAAQGDRYAYKNVNYRLPEQQRELDTEQLAERKANIGWHLSICPWSRTADNATPTTHCVCGADQWLIRRAAAQGEARERVKPRGEQT